MLLVRGGLVHSSSAKPAIWHPAAPPQPTGRCGVRAAGSCIHRTPYPGSNVAEPDRTAAVLTAKQTRALAALLAGLGPQAAAKRARCARSTLWKWLTDDGPFREAYQRDVLAIRQAARLRAGAIVDRALDNVVNAIMGDGDLKASLALLRGTGILHTRVDAHVDVDLRPPVRLIHVSDGGDDWTVPDDGFGGVTVMMPAEDEVPPEEDDV